MVPVVYFPTASVSNYTLAACRSLISQPTSRSLPSQPPCSMPPLSHPRCFPTPAPGGSVIGSIGSQFSAARSQTLQSNNFPTAAMAHISNNSAHIPTRSVSCFLHGDRSVFEGADGKKSVRLARMVQNLSRERVASLAIQARIRQNPGEFEEELRRIVVGAVSEGILNTQDIQTDRPNSFMSLPTDVRPHLTPTKVPRQFPLVACISLVCLINGPCRSNFALHLTSPSGHESSSSRE